MATDNSNREFRLPGLSTLYNISPETDWNDMLNDASCFLSTATGQIRTLAFAADEGSTEIQPQDLAPYLLGVCQLLDQCDNLLQQAHQAMFDHQPDGEEEKPAPQVANFARPSDRENIEQLGHYHDGQIDMLGTMFEAIQLADGNGILAQKLANVASYLASHFESDSDLLVRGMLEDADRNAANREAIQ